MRNSRHMYEVGEMVEHKASKEVGIITSLSLDPETYTIEYGFDRVAHKISSKHFEIKGRAYPKDQTD